MKKKYIIITITIIITLILILGVIKFIISFKEGSNNQQTKMNEITTTYTLLEESINNYNNIRKTLTNRLSTYYQDTFRDNYSDTINLMQNYDQIIGEIQEEINLIAKDCANNIFNDSNVNNICKNYQETYEQLVNTYVNDINDINTIIEDYNNDTNSSLAKFNSNYINNYIDYNQDGEYIGKN